MDIKKLKVGTAYRYALDKETTIDVVVKQVLENGKVRIAGKLNHPASKQFSETHVQASELEEIKKVTKKTTKSKTVSVSSNK